MRVTIKDRSEVEGTVEKYGKTWVPKKTLYKKKKSFYKFINTIMTIKGTLLYIIRLRIKMT